jgi:hypothetical protein
MSPLFHEIHRLAAEGYGYEDIAVKLGLWSMNVRQFVIKGSAHNARMSKVQTSLGAKRRGARIVVRGDRSRV